MAKVQKCQNCKYWTGPRDYAVGMSNTGMCRVLVEKKPVPIWATQLLHLTISWQGENCETFSGKLEEPSGRAL